MKRDCPKCDAEMEREEGIQDYWDYGTDTHKTSSTYYWVCTNQECKHEFEETGDE